MKLDRGLFTLDFEDHYAVLGIPLTADARFVRKRYLTIARKLHPDSLSAASEVDAQQASELLSKWVNPAYEALSQEKSATEYQIVLKLKGQGLRRSSTPPVVTSEAAQALLKAPQVESIYRQTVNTMAATQYEQLSQVIDIIGQLSELNLVYLYRTSEGDAAPSASAAPAASPSASASPAAKAQPAATQPHRKSQAAILESYINRAQEFETDRDYSRAVLEMREALKTYPNSAQCHSYLASLYLKSGQGTMARIHAKRALDIYPDDEMARTIQAKLAKSTPNSAGQATKAADKGKTADKGKATDKGGGFFGLFGGKKK